MEKLNSLFIVLLVVVGLVFSASCNSCQSQKNAGKEIPTAHTVLLKSKSASDHGFQERPHIKLAVTTYRKNWLPSVRIFLNKKPT